MNGWEEQGGAVADRDVSDIGRGSSPSEPDPTPLPTEGLEPIRFARALADAQPFKDGNISDTYRGQILIDSGETVLPAILKDLPLRELANELLGAVVVRELGLPAPVSYLAIAPPEAFAATKAPVSPEGDRLVFASSEQPTPSLKQRWISASDAGRATLLESVASWPQAGGAYVVDSWIANVDRNLGNLLFGAAGETWLIDHGQALTGPVWTAGDLRADGEYVNKLALWMTPSMTAAQIKAALALVAQMERRLPTLDIDALLQASHLPALLPAHDLEAVRSFLQERIPFVGYYASKALGEARLV